MAQSASLWAFARAFRKHLFAAMSGGFSVPFTALAVFADNKYAQLIFGCLAFFAAWFAAYRIWKAEHEKVLDLEQKIESSTQDRGRRQKIVAALDTARDVLQALAAEKVTSQQEYDAWISKFKNVTIPAVMLQLLQVLSQAQVTSLIVTTPKAFGLVRPSGFAGDKHARNLTLQAMAEKIGDAIEKYSD
jgi:hypothetical protein